GRFLEHSRIYWFHHNGKNKVYLSSADMMTRNMVRRVEILFPIYAVDIKQRIMDSLEIQFADTQKARVQDSTGKYHYKEERSREDGTKVNSQELFIEEAMKSVTIEE